MRSLLILAALLFALPAHAVTIDWVTVRDPGNAPDDTGYGSVAYTYLISKHEVTNAQYAEFLNAVAVTDTHGLYHTSMGSGQGGITRTGNPGGYAYSAIAGRENMPVTASFYDALRFANWLHNGQPTGAQDSTTTEEGAYTMITETFPDGPFITRNSDATVILPSEDEWYKAAYFDGAGYFDYPAGADAQTGCVLPSGDTGNSANCGFAVGDLTDVGVYSLSGSPYGTFDQGGNLWEWNEFIMNESGMEGLRGLRGGSFQETPSFSGAGVSFAAPPDIDSSYGFRVARWWGPLECDDGVDNDGDGLIDYPADPGCRGLSGIEGPACHDGIDNDGDGLIDYPADPGCRDACSRFENSTIFHVDSEVDQGDALPGNGICATSIGTCTLRAAIQETNAVPREHAVVVPAGHYVLTIPGTGENAAAAGDLDISSSLNIIGAGAQGTVIDAAGIDRVLELHPSAESVEITGVTITGGSTEGDGGGICAGWCDSPFGDPGEVLLTIHDSVISGNTALMGGGIASSSDLRLVRVTVSDNRAADGGALLAWLSSIAIVNSTISGNGTRGVPPVLGGGTCSGSTVGGIYGAGHVTLANSTVADNYVLGIGGSCGFQRIHAVSGSILLRHSIVANPNLYADCGGGTSGGYNIDSDGTCGLTNPTDLPNTSPLLGPLQDNGGPTFTHALLPGSPAINAIPTTDCVYDDDGDAGTPEVPVTEDQRGVVRPQGGNCDIGAYEVTVCADGLDNDGDGRIDFDPATHANPGDQYTLPSGSGDPGCFNPSYLTESPQCQDGLDNDGDGGMDYDAGLSANGVAHPAGPDSRCVGSPWVNIEAFPTCGLGAELALLLPPLMWLWRRRSRR